MKNFDQLCCEKCWHTPQNPCEHFIQCCTEGPLCHSDEKCRIEISSLRKRLRYEEHELPIIIIGMGTCGLASGAGKVKETIQEELKKLNIEAIVESTGCIGYCAVEPIVDVKLPGEDRVSYCEIIPKIVPKFLHTVLVEKKIFKEKLLGTHGKTNQDARNINEIPFFEFQRKIVLSNCGIINPDSIDTYLAYGGFKAFDRVVRLMKPEEVIKEISISGLRGRGGGGFPTGKKWELAHKQTADQKYLICNADEGDPGAFMDRSLLESDPFSVIEGMMIAAYAIGASQAYIYCRAEYPLAIEKLQNAINLCERYGILGDNILNTGFSLHIKIKKGAGAFVCGEETALIASIEGKRGMPRPRPPYPVQAGLWGKPTVINNVETFANVPPIIMMGGQEFAKIGTEKSKGTKVFALSGNVKNTGLVEVPMGTTLADVVFKIGGGIPNGKEFKAVQIGGPSGGCIPEHLIDTPVDYESLKEIGAMMGSGGFVVMDEDTCMVDVAKYFLTFIQQESCGKCVPCREGTKRMLEIIERIPQRYSSGKDKNEQLLRFKGMIHLQRLADVIKDTSLCGLGQSAPNPVLSGLRYFREEYEEHLYDRRCSAGVCKELLTFTIDNEKCTGCGICLRKCSVEAIVGEKGQAHYILDEKCIKCGMCVENCRFEAINVN
ncbi:MAG: NADH-quinone oxidoreductase subunit NuoF [Ignavibacterium album]|uniref:NADH-quinone oxidoreductase subunit NuoF n=1 Tax=Ignavibacterium album TaxID=591197 RepID=UPI0026EDD968|nr:NADH-quinone oxidoreductase subunit NuoF [Ignavibacterium album]MBI5662491.1 NADH-quinone oxidoreductase subunit NuoF [Ignavibacterium album]